jgi:universal stress protein A
MAYPFKKILCPIDFDENSIAALATAAKMARQFDATVEVVHVVPIVVQPGGTQVYADVYATEEQSSKAKLAELAKFHLAGVKYELRTTVALPSAAILHAAKNLGADVIVMSTHGRRGLSHLFMGSVAERVVREAQCPVLTVHGSSTAETTASAPA